MAILGYNYIIHIISNFEGRINSNVIRKVDIHTTKSHNI